MKTRTTLKLFGSVTLSVPLLALGLSAAQAQQVPQSPDMTFFVTSAGPGKGADLGGLEGADRLCQQLAQGAGAGNKTWRASGARISLRKRWAARRPSMRVTASGAARG